MGRCEYTTNLVSVCVFELARLYIFRNKMNTALQNIFRTLLKLI